MYWAPNCDQQDFLSELKQLLDISIKHQHSIILGDFNNNLIETSQPPPRNFKMLWKAIVASDIFTLCDSENASINVFWKPITTVSPLHIEINKYLKHHGWLQDC